MKKIILLILVMFVGLTSYNQTKTVEIPKQDTSLIYIADSLNSVGEDIKIIGETLQEHYKQLGFVGFVRVYKYFIITILIFIILTLLWFKNGNNNKN